MLKLLYRVKIAFLLLLLISANNLAAQNLVSNPSFETHTICPNGFMTIAAPPSTVTVNNWFLASPGTSDYFNTCSLSQTGVPQNFFGWQQPRTGDAYIGGYWVFTDSFASREYMQTQLTTPLVAGQQYYISFWLSLAETNTAQSGANALATYQVGAYFGAASVNQWVNQLPLVPQVINPVGNYITDTSGWVKVEGTYTAAGGESWLIIGNFSPFTSQNYITYATTPNTPVGYGYYYMDDVCVFNMSTAGNVTVHDTSICDQNNAVLNGRVNMQNYEWNTGAVTQSLVISQTGTYWVKSMGECEAWIDTFHVNALGAITPPELGNDTAICYGKSLTVDAQSPVYTEYLWSTGAITSDITIAASGKYYVTVESDCGTFSDTINVTVKPEVPMAPSLDTVLCTGAGANIILPLSGQQIKWHTSPQDPGVVQQPRIDASYAGSYVFYLTRTVDGCESDPSLVTINVLNTPKVDLPEDTALCLNQKVTLGKQVEGVEYLWNTGSTNCCIDVHENGMYHLKAFNYCGTAEAETAVLFSDCEHCIWTSNAFSPNGDGLNDVFEIKNLCPLKTYQIKIYNRFGQLVFSSNDISRHWDGTFNGTPCDASTYFYYLKADAEQAAAPEIQQKGDVILIR
jgi:gliding motility-associated-like protein